RLAADAGLSAEWGAALGADGQPMNCAPAAWEVAARIVRLTLEGRRAEAAADVDRLRQQPAAWAAAHRAVRHVLRYLLSCLRMLHAQAALSEPADYGHEYCTVLRAAAGGAVGRAPAVTTGPGAAGPSNAERLVALGGLIESVATE